MEGQLGLPCGVDVNHLLGLHVALLVVDAGLDDAVPDGLRAQAGGRAWGVPKGSHRAGTWYPQCPQFSLDKPQPKPSSAAGRGNGGTGEGGELWASPKGWESLCWYLGNDELGVLGAVQLQLLGNVGQGDAGVGEADHADTCREKGMGSSPLSLPSLAGLPKRPPTCLDDIVPQPNDQSVGAISLELVPKLVKDLVELGQVPRPDGWREEGGNGGRRKAGESESGLADFLLLLLPKWHLHPSPIKGREENCHWVPSHSGYFMIL